MTNSTGTAGGVGSPQGGQQGWDEDLNTQAIPPSNEGTTSAGMTGTVYDPSKETDMAKTKTDAERAKLDEQASGDTTEDNYQLPEGVSTAITRGEKDLPAAEEPEEQPLPTPEEQMSGIESPTPGNYAQPLTREVPVGEEPEKEEG